MKSALHIAEKDPKIAEEEESTVLVTYDAVIGHRSFYNIVDKAL